MLDHLDFPAAERQAELSGTRMEFLKLLRAAAQRIDEGYALRVEELEAEAHAVRLAPHLLHCIGDNSELLIDR